MTSPSLTTPDESQVLVARPHVTLNRSFYDASKSDGNLTYRLPDADGTLLTYKTPGGYAVPLNDENAARLLVQQVGQPMMTFRNPTKATGAQNLLARARSGWFYTTPDGLLNQLHGAVDYYGDTSKLDGSIDPSFRVYAVASGMVINVYWDFWSGNTVILEHIATNGMLYRSIYCHLRNGPANDQSNAINRSPGSDPTNPAADAIYKRYRLFAQKTNPRQIWWGTEQQTLLVRPNQWVNAGDQLGWAGNTGPGGAGADLDATGTPLHPNWANVHLHMFFAVREPGAISVPGVPAQWMLIDPYGAYNAATASSYIPGQPTPFPRFITGDA